MHLARPNSLVNLKVMTPEEEKELGRAALREIEATMVVSLMKLKVDERTLQRLVIGDSSDQQNKALLSMTQKQIKEQTEKLNITRDELQKLGPEPKVETNPSQTNV